jgi:hypothetical protein
MGPKTVALLLVLSWIIFSRMDILEDFSLKSRATASSSPATAKPVNLNNDNVELANRVSLCFEKFPKYFDLGSITATVLVDPDSRAFRSHKDNCVFLI